MFEGSGQVPPGRLLGRCFRPAHPGGDRGHAGEMISLTGLGASVSPEELDVEVDVIEEKLFWNFKIKNRTCSSKL